MTGTALVAGTNRNADISVVQVGKRHLSGGNRWR
jgi:hypothetical protein